jgi:hypothetical protein
MRLGGATAKGATPRILSTPPLLLLAPPNMKGVGWVNWSGLATVIQGFLPAVSQTVDRLLGGLKLPNNLQHLT